MQQKIGLLISNEQIASLKAGNILTTCESKERLEKIEPSIISERLNSIGQVYDVADEGGQVQTQAKLKDCFLTTFGSPDLKSKVEYEKFWKSIFPNENLKDSTELFVTVWEPFQGDLHGHS